MIILLGQSVQDSVAGKDVYTAFAVRMGLFILVTLYACLMVHLLDQRPPKPRSGINLIPLALQATGIGRRTGGRGGFLLRPAFLALTRCTHHRTRRGRLFGPVLPIILLHVVIDTIVKLIVLTSANLSARRSGSGTDCRTFQAPTGWAAASLKL